MKHQKQVKRYRPSTGRPVRLKTRAHSKAYRDYTGVMRLRNTLVVTGILLGIVLAVFGTYVTINGIIPYVQEQLDAASMSSEASSEVSEPEEESSMAWTAVYDEKGLQIFDSSVSLRLINKEHPAGAEDQPALAFYEGVEVDERIVPALTAMAEAAAADGVALTVTDGYVSYDEQQEAYDAEVLRLEQAGETHIMAMSSADKQVGRPGMCDLQTGMCVRLASGDEEFTKTPAYQWLNNHSLEYGFVFRYPKNGEVATGMKADLAVIRYVGAANARQMRRLDMTLEEYVDYIAQQG